MDKTKRSRAVETVKDVLIVLLTCSALYLAARSQLMNPLSGFWREEAPQTGTVQTESMARADAARPLRMIAHLEGATGVLRYGVQYDTATSDGLFQQVAGLLAEALSGAGAPEQITRYQWEQALLMAPGISFDFQGELPMAVLAGWLAGEDTHLEGAVRHLTLTMWQDAVALYYRDEETGAYYRCLSEMANGLPLTETLSTLAENGAVYAFESEDYQDLDPDTLITGEPPVPAVYTASNPMAGGRAALEALMDDLGLSVDSSSFYSSGNEQVARSGNSSIRLSADGTAVYQADSEEDSLFLVSMGRSNASVFEAVEACRKLAADTIGTNCGEARFYLTHAREGEAGLEVRFDYCLNGAPVRLEEGTAAWFLVRNGQIVQFEFRFRSYADSGETTVVLPVRQAMAVMDSLGRTGEELLLMYSDTGGERVTAAWTATGARTAGGA